ncbi:hypothetical protein M9H77_31851 [Catharanthus roseus]|uniref:Uncharacterized protein n=1 Tax=Catharanthus roseus TaxID=4058 RepID=A0ACC0A249_CATRO|nr:hypothetical protein M9H77_31851 [Catharanthus roseus]
MPVMSFSLTELVDEIRKEYPDINLPPVIEAYYKKDAEYQVFHWNTEQNSEGEDESIDNEEAPSREEGRSEEEPTEDSRKNPNRDTLDKVITENNKGGVFEADKSVTDIQEDDPERPANDMDKDQEDSNTMFQNQHSKHTLYECFGINRFDWKINGGAIEE